MRTPSHLLILAILFALLAGFAALTIVLPDFFTSPPLSYPASAGTLETFYERAAQTTTRIPAGTEIPVTFTSGAVSGKTKAGEVISATVARDIWIRGRIALRKGVKISGSVTASRSAKKEFPDALRRTEPRKEGHDVAQQSEDVAKNGSEARGALLSVEFDRIAGRSVELNLVSPDLNMSDGRSNRRFLTGSILLGAILGHQINQRRAEVGALIGGLAGAADATRPAREIRIRAGESGIVKLSKEFTL